MFIIPYFAQPVLSSVRPGLLPSHLPALPRPARRRHPHHRPPHRLQPPPHRRRPGPRRPSSFHSVLSRRRWSTLALARILARFILDHWVPDGPVYLAGDDTVDEHRGAKVYGKGCHRDPVRSTHSYTAYRWGHKWVVLAILVSFPFATRPWALPVLVALYRSPEKAARPGQGQAPEPGRPKPRPRPSPGPSGGPADGCDRGSGGTRRPRS